MLYQAVVQTVLLFEAETWVLLDTMSTNLEGGTRRFPKADNGSEGGATGGRNLAVGGSREGPLEGSNSVPRNLYLQDSGNIGGVGGVASYLGGM